MERNVPLFMCPISHTTSCTKKKAGGTIVNDKCFPLLCLASPESLIR